MRLIFIFLFIAITHNLWGQTDSIPTDSTIYKIKMDIDLFEQLKRPDSLGQKQVRISGDFRIQQLIQLNKSIHKKENSFPGFRIQLLSRGSYNADMESLQNFVLDFLSEFPDIPIYLQYVEPDFKIRIGNFHSRLESIPALKRVEKKYPNAYPVKTIIYRKELLEKFPPQIIKKDE